uniref:Molybdopterin biosynthesis protein n=1 Tax=Osmundaria fimbriata TaxID=228265 RepID=A0A1Z1M4U3_OSMFI|nr:Molybdopterin biosynthesis protein [Osmundaria fimbriata]ARW60920.1 Molybdopterin biosynthesis protein [Osmundaria fimbriata]
MLNPNSNSVRISNREYDRYCKQLILENIGIEGQKRLKQSKVLIIGAGGLGCPVMLYLVTSGIGYIGILDKDIIELANLNRQILYTIKEINKYKIVAAKNKLKKLNDNCKIIKHLYNLNHDNGFEIICYYDIIIDTTDNFKTRYIIDEICYKLHKIHIYGAIDNFEGHIGIFNYKNGIRYRDLYPIEYKLKYQNCNDNGVIGTTAGYIGVLQATEAIKIILGLGKIHHNSIYICSLLNMNIQEKRIYSRNEKMHKSKKYHNLFKDFNIISKSNLTNLSNKLLILDIRRKKEFQEKHIQKSINIPLIRFKINKTMQFITECSKEKNIIIYCNTMNRSIIAHNYLKQYQIKSYIIRAIHNIKDDKYKFFQ